MGESDTLLNAVIGAAVTLVTSFVPFSPVIGGAVAGYLQREDTLAGAKVGALSGLLYAAAAAVFVVPFLLFVFLGAELPAFGAVFLLAGAAVLAAITAGLGALGGVIGVYVREETDIGGDGASGGPGHPSEWDTPPMDADERRPSTARDYDRPGDYGRSDDYDRRSDYDASDRQRRRSRETEREDRY